MLDQRDRKSIWSMLRADGDYEFKKSGRLEVETVIEHIEISNHVVFRFCVQVKVKKSVPHLADLTPPLASSSILSAVATLGYSLSVSMNTSSYSALLLIEGTKPD